MVEKALRVARERYPQGHGNRAAAFANSVTLLVKGRSGGCGGPSVRERAVAAVYWERVGEYSFDQAVELLIDPGGLIFGPLGELHRHCWGSEHCFDDDPADVRELTRLSSAS